MQEHDCSDRHVMCCRLPASSQEAQQAAMPPEGQQRTASQQAAPSQPPGIPVQLQGSSLVLRNGPTLLEGVPQHVQQTPQVCSGMMLCFCISAATVERR